MIIFYRSLRNLRYNLLFSFHKKLKIVEKEIIQVYEKSLRSFLVDYMLTNPLQKHFFNINVLPLEWPIFVIRPPVPWHQSKVTATHFMEHNLFITNEIARCIRSIWHER